MKWQIALVPFVLCFMGHAQDQHADSIKRFAKTAVFAFGGVGFAGITSEGEKEFHVIMALPTAAEDFEKIYAIGNPEARSYALVAIRELNRARFKELITSLNGSPQQVVTMEGCIMQRRTLAKIAQDIDSGQYDSWLKLRERTH